MQKIKETINKFFDLTSTEKWKKMLCWLMLGSFLIYFFIAISAYATWFPNSTHIFVYSSTSGKVLRAFISILIIFVGVLTMLTYRNKIKFRWMFLFGILILFNLLSALVTPTEIYTLYTQNILYNFLSSLEMHVSTFDVFLGFLSFSVDIIFGYLCLFVFPLAFDKKIFITLLSVFLAVMFYSFIYSFVKEREYYKYFLSGDWRYSAESIGSIFGAKNKQQWGIFLCVVPPASCLLIYFLNKIKMKRIIKIVAYVLLCLCMFLSFICGIVSFCKTAILSSIFFFVVLFISVIINLFAAKKGKLLPIFLTFLLGIAIFTIISFYVIPSLKATKIGEMFQKILDTLISSGTDSAQSRLQLVITTLQNFPSVNLFIGVPKGIFEYYGKAIAPELSNGLHTGIAIYFGRTGVFGMIIYIFVLIKLIVNIIKIFKNNKLLGGVLFGTFCVSIILNLSELEILIMSSSMNVFMLNIILVIFTQYTIIKMEDGLNEEIVL